MGKLTDRKKKRIIADYVQCGNYREVARAHKVSDTTVRRIVKDDPETAEKIAQKKNENATDILKHMESRKKDVCVFIDKYLDAMMSDEKIASASVNQLSTAFGTVIDKFAIVNSGGDIDRLDRLLGEIKRGAYGKTK